MPSKKITTLLDRNWIRASSSPRRAPMVFVKKLGELQFDVDYWSLNTITKKDRHPFSLVKKNIDQYPRRGD